MEKAITLVSKEIFCRFWYFVFCFFFSCLCSWFYGKEVLYLYLYPLFRHSQNIMFTSISEAFTTTLSLSICLGFVCSFPFFLYVCVCFFLPCLYLEERIFFYKTCFYTYISFYAGILICIYYVIPELLSWFLQYGVSTDFLFISLQAKVSSYISWSGKIYIFCICILQMPVGFWVFFSFYKYKFSFKNRKYVSICILLFCAAVSPPDFYNQCFLFSFCMALYEYILWYGFVQYTMIKKTKNLDFIKTYPKKENFSKTHV